MAKTLYLTNRKAWRQWLQKHHTSETEIWLISYKKHTGQPSIPYEEAVAEALCFGWIDSIVKRLDDERFAQKYTPRRAGSNWSSPNLRRMRQLILEGRMTEAGLAKIDPALLKEEYQPSTKKQLSLPPSLEKLLRANAAAWENFLKLAPSHRRNYLAWILDAKKEETRLKRLEECIGRLKQNKKLGLK